MAIAIKAVPILKGDAANRFEALINLSGKKKATIDFRDQSHSLKRILAKARI